MNFYNKYILPKVLNRAMKNTDLGKYRNATAGEVSGVVLEIGFGSGLNLPYYKNISMLYALDVSNELYDLAQENIKNFSFPIKHLLASAESVPLDDNSIDCVVSTWTLCSIPHPEIALKEISRVLKPGGRFGFVEHGKSPHKFIAKMQNIFNPILKCLAGGCNMNRDMQKLILDAGFEIQKIDKFGQKFKLSDFMYIGVAVVNK